MVAWLCQAEAAEAAEGPFRT